MANARVIGAEQPGLAKKPYSTELGILGIISMVISVLSGWLLAFDFLGYHAPGRPPHPEISSLLLVLGLSLVTVGQYGRRQERGNQGAGMGGRHRCSTYKACFCRPYVHGYRPEIRHARTEN